MLSRRQFIVSSASLLASLWGSNLTKGFANTYSGSAKSVILLWMGGGMAHTETFDPKEYRPFKKGMLAKDISTTFPKIETAIDGLHFSKGLENIAKVIDRGSVLRSVLPGNFGDVLHSRYQYLWHTGYSPPITFRAPHMGAWISYLLGERVKGVKTFVEIGQNYNNFETNELKSFLSGGFLGAKHSPISVSDPRKAKNLFSAKNGESKREFLKRINLHKLLFKDLNSDVNQQYIYDLQESFEETRLMLESPMINAFNLDLEKESSAKKYGNTKFGKGCLLARRLIESGVRFVEVSSDYVPFESWDTHANGHMRTKELKKMIDSPVSGLILDLEERGLLDETLIILASEFSRDTVVEGSIDNIGRHNEKQPSVINKISEWGLHRHYTGASSVLLFGGGVKQGNVYGETADVRPCKVIKDPINLIDLHATIYSVLGISPDSYIEVDKRPIFVTKDGKGKLVKDLLKSPLHS